MRNLKVLNNNICIRILSNTYNKLTHTTNKNNSHINRTNIKLKITKKMQIIILISKYYFDSFLVFICFHFKLRISFITILL